MLLTQDEMRFDFGGAKLDPTRDRAAIAWAMNQFLYGEVTGIQVGHWIYHAPDLEAARFLARQAVEEFQHVGNFVQILAILGERPGPAHPLVRLLATGMMGGGWAEHVALEMALGEGFVLQAFYALIDLIDEPQIVAILKRGVRQEEGHVDFGERRTTLALAEDPSLRPVLLGLSLLSVWVVGRLGRAIEGRMPAGHPVFARLPAFVAHAVGCAELRMRRMGLLDRPLAELSRRERASLAAAVARAKAKSLVTAPLRLVPGLGESKLTDHYLRDPEVEGPRSVEPARARSGAERRAREAGAR